MKKFKWEKIWEVADAPIFEMGHGTVFGVKKLEEISGYKIKGQLLYGEKEVLISFHSQEDLDSSTEFGYKYFLENKQKYIKEVKVLIEEFANSSSSLFNRVDSISDFEAIKNLLNDVSNKQIEVFAYFNLTNPQFIGRLEKELSEAVNSQDALTLLTTPESKSTLQEEEEAFYKLLAPYSKSDILKEELQNKLEKHSNKYRFLSGNEGAGEWDLEYYTDLAKNVFANKVDIKAKLEEVQQHGIVIKKQKERLLNNLKLSSSIIEIADIFQNLSYLRLELRILWSNYYRLLRKLIYKLSRNLEIPAYDLMSLSPTEIKNISKDSTFIKGAKYRFNNYLFVITEDDTQSFYGSDAKLKFDREVPTENLDGITMLFGDSAYGGEVEGLAYCFNWSDSDFNKKLKEMPKGSIIVIGNTRPSLMPAIRKSKAIVTDEGGITSHAAIVSRELKIPCVIGTKNATKVIKTGMHLIVNADKGIVKVI